MFISERQAIAYDRALLELYACDDSKQLSSLVLQLIRRLIPFDSGGFFPIKPETCDLLPPVILDLDEKLFALYEKHYQNNDIYRRRVFFQPVIPIVDRCSDYLEFSHWEKTNAHRADFLLPNKMYYLAGIQLFTNGKLSAMISIHRERRRADFNDGEIVLLRALAHHVNSAHQRIRQIDELYRCKKTELASPNVYVLSGPFTRREREIIALIVEGSTVKVIGNRLGISPETVKSHLKNIYAKAEVNKRADLIGKIYRRQI
ncbi:MAG: LuxR C-terminal-related transcriptional regulator [Negativicutes bacterium]|nr:LuxR C-terminal-related transcriptional regulator [Negativicutes bacterium]